MPPAIAKRIAALPPLPRKRPAIIRTADVAQASRSLSIAALAIRPPVRAARPGSGPFAIASSHSTSEADMRAVKRVVELARKGKGTEADAEKNSIHDPVARKLSEWAILHSNNIDLPFKRYADFIAANPTWPHVELFRRRAEDALWNDRMDDATVRAFFAKRSPTTAKGHFVLARVLLDQGDRAGAQALVRAAWRHQDFSPDVEEKVLEMFGGLITRADQKARMDERLYAHDIPPALRCAHRLGGAELSIARARAAVIERSSKAKALLEAVPSSARDDPGYIFSRIRWLRREDRISEAVSLMLSAPRDPAVLVDTDRWWQERRILVRKLLDEHKPGLAYRLARDAAPPGRDNYRVDWHFTAGWIALRFLHEPATALAHFAKIPNGTFNPHALSRAGYWEGRAADAMGLKKEAKDYYESAAQYTATYYGQLARARLGLTKVGLRGPVPLTAEERATLNQLEIVRAVEILYKIGERELVAPIYAELGQSATDIAGMAVLGELAGRYGDGRAMVLLGKAALGRGLPLDYYAYPIVGLPDYKPVGPPISPTVAYSIARQESHFNQKVVSPAHAMGLMQVTPEAAIDTAKRYKVRYNRSRLLNDPVYNMQMGAAELGNLLQYYRGSYLLTFAGYNAGRGRVKQWIEAYGDPRDPGVDPVDWVERIPFSETRNYVERIMENLQVYRARFGGSRNVLIEADLRRGSE